MADERKLTKKNHYGVGRFPVGPGGVHKCPVCEKTIFEEYNSSEICEVCKWEDCGQQEDNPDCGGGANKMSLNQAREAFKKGIPIQ